MTSLFLGEVKKGGKIRGLEFLFSPLNLRQREKGSMGIGKNKSFDFGSIKKKKPFYMQVLSGSLTISSPKYDQ